MKPNSQNRSPRGLSDTFARRSAVREGSVISRHPLAVCVVCGVLAVAFVLLYVAQVNARAQEAHADMLTRYGGEQVEVCVASRDIAVGETVDATCVTMRVWVANLLPRGAVRAVQDVVGRKATSAIIAGEVICEARFAQVSEELEVPYGMTAVTVPAKDVQAVGGAIEPGMRIDIYATGNSATQLIGSGILVLATSKQPGGGTVGAGSSAAAGQSLQWITLALSPESVEETVAAAQGLALYFALPGEGVSAVAVTRDAAAGSETGADGEILDSAPDGGDLGLVPGDGILPATAGETGGAALLLESTGAAGVAGSASGQEASR